MSDEESTAPDEVAEEETPTFANRAERRAKGKAKGKGAPTHQQRAGGFTGKGGSYQPPRNYGSRRSG
ncbi:hypothetical protein [Asanoa iriomotensis]|uniref:Uncharacterized protein n=1 Tax=Asanoa iriomotensis TaxID=234613 RepID=A0ABQ4CAS0_9ACTN|nr:hypothetical protein [Asanoa iriomotensis]GIF59859.1 hypothetical protein Air01nite_59540 [Asanoa iriomotensis]